jgi:pimeloyl-ACP methyl ester carboxylesterase
MKKKTKRWLVGIASALAVGFAGLNVLAYNHARAMMHFSDTGTRTTKPERHSFWSKFHVLLVGVNVPRPTGDRSPSGFAPDCRVLSVDVPVGVTLESWYCNRGEETPLVILFHGYSAEKTSLLEEAKALLDLDASVLLVDFRGSGGSSESYTTIGVNEADDVVAVVRYAETHLAHSKTILFGQSMGAVAILRAVHEHDIQPDSVILEAVFDTMLNTVRNRFHAMHIPSFPSAELLVFWGGRQWEFDGFKHNPVDYASSVHCPALFMHGQHDPRATLDEGRRVFDAVPGPKEWVQFERTGHQSYIAMHPSDWRTAVKKTIRRAENKVLEDIGVKPPNPQH